MEATATKYNFKVLERGKWGAETYDGIRVGEKGAGVLTGSVYTRLGNPEFVQISVDPENNSIHLRKATRNDLGSFKVGGQKGQSYSLATGAIRRAGMAAGRYYYVEDYNGGIVLSSVQREL